MYFFACELDDVIYGFVRASCKQGDLLETAYKWLAQYCNFFPPLWLSSDQGKLTGYSVNCGKILFAFKNINGFPVSYRAWQMLLGTLVNLDTNDYRYIDQRLVEDLDDMKESGDINCSRHGTLDDFLKKNVFVNKDQFVVRSLDLRKSALIICNDEAQRLAISRKGFPSRNIKVTSLYSRLNRGQQAK